MNLTSIAMLVAAVLMSGCASDINRTNADAYYRAGLQAEARRDWRAAREAYRRALVNSRSGGASAAYISGVTYNLGRMAAYSCDFEEGERLLLESVTLEQGLPSPNAGNLTKRWSELARLYQAKRQHQEAVAFYAKAVPELDRLRVADADPLGFASYLEEYARELSLAGRHESAEQTSARAVRLRAGASGKQAQFVPVNYTVLCPDQK